MYNEIKLSCAECLFSLACQRPLSKTDTLQLIGHLKDDSSLAADGTLSPVALNLLMALLYCFDVSIVEREDSDGEHELCLPAASNKIIIPAPIFLPTCIVTLLF